MADLEVDLQWAIDPRPIPSLAQCERWASVALLPENTREPCAVTIRIVDVFESQDLNLTYRQKDSPTNVLSFPYEPMEFELPEALQVELEEVGDDFKGKRYLGDLVICADVVEQEAKTQHKSLEAHWAHMVVHGMLHLQGLDHIEEAEAEAMEALEIKILAELGFDNPYHEVCDNY
jgi:probable rRNA maturation factor